MKKLLFLFFAFSLMQLSAQNMLSQSKSNSSSSASLIESLTANQVEGLTKKLHLNESQQKIVSGLIVSQLKSERFQKFLKGIGADKLIAAGNVDDVNEKVQNELLLDGNFQKGMSSILDQDQMKTMKTYIPK